jgi:predicted O-methyltransferase YrrM
MRRGKKGLGLRELVDYINKIAPTKDMTLIEIGAYAGESTSIFCDNFKSVITIDPFINGYDHSDKASFMSPMSKVYEAFCQNMQKYDNYRLIQKTSDEAILELADQQFDVIYIDGVHQYAQANNDIINYSKIVKAGGFITGHDYARRWPGVVKAVLENCGKPHMKFKDSSWLIRKDNNSPPQV